MADRQETPQDPAQPNGLITLPDWKKMDKPFDRIAVLDTHDSIKDTLVLWWKEFPRREAQMLRLYNATNSPALPKNDAAAAEEILEKNIQFLNQINGLLTELAIDTSKDVGFKRLVIEYVRLVNPFDDQSATDDASRIAGDIGAYKENYEEKAELAAAVSEAVIEGVGAGKSPEEMQQKAAQAVFDEMINQLTQNRITAVHDIESLTSDVIDSPEVEKSDLTSAFLGEAWTGEERRSRLRNYNKLKRVLEKLGAETGAKVGLNTLWRWANGDLPQDASILRILNYTNELDYTITRELSQAWEAERDMLEDDQE